MRRVITFFIVFFSVQSIMAQKLSVNGYVLDQQSGEPIIGATVYEMNTDNFSITNNYGYFSMNLSKGQHLLIASYVGYYPDTIRINLSKSKTLFFKLKSSTTLKEIVIVAGNTIDKEPLTSRVDIPMEQIRLLPSLGGETDIFRAFQIMPGVVQGNEGRSALFVRGGSDDENLILLDGVPLYYVNHLGGFISVFNSDAINSVNLYKGNFSARYGGRLSSVLDVSMKNGNMKKFSGAFTSGMLVSKILLEYPLKRDTSSLLFSFRTSPVGWALIPFTYLALDNEMYLYYAFYDVNLKYNYFFNNKNRVYFSFYNGDDPLTMHLVEKNGEKADVSNRWGNTLFAFRWNHIWNYKLFSNLTLTYTLFRYGFFTNYFQTNPNSEFEYKNISGIRDWALNYDFSWDYSKHFRVNFGTQNILHFFRPFVSYYSYSFDNGNGVVDTSFNSSSTSLLVFENSIYAQAVINYSKLSVNCGLRISNYNLLDTKKNYFSPEPRITLRYSFLKDISLKAAYAYNSQFVHRITGLGQSEIPIDLWLPSTDKIVPEFSHQWTIGLYKSRKDFEFSAEVFYKTMNNLITYPESYNLYIILSDWQNSIETHGSGYAYGLELFLRKKTGRTRGWIAYTYSRSFRIFENINFGQPYPFEYDRPHDLKIVLMHRIKHNIVFSAQWLYGTGYPYTKPLGYLPTMENVGGYEFYSMLLWEPRNSSRMEAYHRLDVAMLFTKKKKHGIRTWSINIYNAYNHLNPYYYTPDYEWVDNKPGKWVMKKFTLFPIIPSISYSFKW